MQEQKEQFGEIKEQTPKKVFVEIGTYSSAVTWIGNRGFGPDELYIGVDINKENASSSRSATNVYMKDRGQDTSNMLFVNADARRMPVKDGSADEVFIGNVLGDPLIRDVDKERFISEAERMMSENGRLIIKENNTPADIAKVRKFLEKNNLKEEKIITNQSPEWNEAIRQYQRAGPGVGEAAIPDSFILYAIRNTP